MMNFHERRRGSMATEAEQVATLRGILTRAADEQKNKRRGSLLPPMAMDLGGAQTGRLHPQENIDIGRRRGSLLNPHEQVSQLRGILLKETKRRSSLLPPQQEFNRGRRGSHIPTTEFEKSKKEQIPENIFRRRKSVDFDIPVRKDEEEAADEGADIKTDKDLFHPDSTLKAGNRSQHGSTELVHQYEVTLTDELRAALQAQGRGEFRPELIVGRSEILDIDDVITLAKNIGETCPWFLTFSTLINGNSLETLYHQAGNIRGATLIIIKTTQKQVFGALLSDPPRLSETYYGTGQSFLFQCRPTFSIYRHTGKDHNFIHGTSEALTVGTLDDRGHCALQLNSTLTEGKTTECPTYGNKPLTPDYNFTVKILECWHFGIISN